MEVVLRFMEEEDIGLVKTFLKSAMYRIPKTEDQMEYIIHLRKLLGKVSFYEVFIAENEEHDIVGIVMWHFNKRVEDATVIIHPYVWDGDEVERQILEGFEEYCQLVY